MAPTPPTALPASPPRPPALALPTVYTTAGPELPFRTPNILGDPQLTIKPFAEFDDLQGCLALGQPVYGIALQNTNVREAPFLDACRIGRIPRGTLVEITALVTKTNPSGTNATALDLVVEPIRTDGASFADNTSLTDERLADESAGQVTLGYLEDIQPIFQRNCIACHSAVVKQMNLQVTSFEALMAGSSRGPVVIPGNFEESPLWVQVSTGKMPLIGELTLSEKEAIRLWIEGGALERRASSENTLFKNRLTTQSIGEVDGGSIGGGSATSTNSDSTEPQNVVNAPIDLWLTVTDESVDPVPDVCANPTAEPQQVVSADLILPISCGVAPRAAQIQQLLQSLAIVPSASRPVGRAASIETTGSGNTVAIAPPAATTSQPVAPRATVPQAGLRAPALGLPAPSDADIWMIPRTDFCVDPHFTQNDRGITALAFAPDGRLFVALDSRLDGEPDLNILYDAHHPSRSIVVYDPSTRFTPNEIMRESSRITGMVHANGALFLNRAGEVGWIQDGGEYRTLAGGFAVNSQLFHANNGLVVTNGYLYVSAGGVRDGYSDGPIVGMGEAGAQNVVAGGNRFAARLVRAPLDRLINEYNIELFETAARGLRNPYGLAVDPSGHLWFTDNGATNVPENVSAGDEVSLFVPSSTLPGTPEDATPYYGFPLALTAPQPWYTEPVVDLYNTSAPTGITWAFDTIYFGQYGHDPGLYRLGRAADGTIVAERIMLVWPLLALTTAPDGALWIGTGTGELYRMVPGC